VTDQQTSTQEIGERHEHGPVHVLINGKKYTFASDDVIGRELKAAAGIADDNQLYLRRHGSNEPIADAERVELHSGDEFFSRPPSNVS
jgi:hypothetical protein